MKRWVAPCLFGFILCGAAVVVLVQSAEAREVSLQAARALFGFFTTPFILEATVALMGLITVLTINEYRRKKEEVDEWVVMPKEDSNKDSE
jgi:hypothetical protein